MKEVRVKTAETSCLLAIEDEICSAQDLKFALSRKKRNAWRIRHVVLARISARSH